MDARKRLSQSQLDVDAGPSLRRSSVHSVTTHPSVVSRRRSVRILDPLVHAVREGDVECVRYLLDFGYDPQANADYDFISALKIAASGGNADIFGLILFKQLGLRMTFEDAVTPTVRGGHEQLIGILCDRGQEVSKKISAVKEELLILEAAEGKVDVPRWVRRNMSALHLACCSESLTSALLQNGAHVNAKDNEGYTALHNASYAWESDVVSLLVHKSDAVNSKTVGGNTALHLACSFGFEISSPTLRTKVSLASARRAFRTVSVLIEGGADVNAANNEMRTPLHLAAASGSADIVSQLLKHDANVHAVDVTGVTCEKYASRVDVKQLLSPHVHKSQSGNEAVSSQIEHRLRGISLGSSDILRERLDSGSVLDSHRSLEEAIFSGSTSLVKMLLRKGADVNVDDNSCTPLLLAVQSPKASIEILRALIVKGACLNVKDHTRRTPLHYAAAERSVEICTLLLNKGADLHATDDLGWTPLHWAARHGATSTALLLMQMGCRYNATTNTGWTTLHCAAAGGAVDIVNFLLPRNVDINGRSSDGWTPLHCVAWHCPPGARANAVTSVLLHYGAIHSKRVKDGLSALHLAAMNGSAGVVSLLLENRADVRLKDRFGRTPLHCAAWRGSAEVIRQLVEEGADIHTRTKKMETPLHWAAANSSPDAVSTLLENGADPKARTREGWTLLHWAALRGAPEIVSQLLEKGARVNERNDHGRTPLHLAVNRWRAYSSVYSVVISMIKERVVPEQPSDEELSWKGDERPNQRYSLIIAALLRKGADNMALDKYGKTPVDLLAIPKSGRFKRPDLWTNIKLAQNSSNVESEN